ncbi:MAG: DUF4925 domain-containing protein [Tannerellaceae bacterium]|nr:DUF4925 domain-containing protein [Tannerellaceae bacterium]
MKMILRRYSALFFCLTFILSSCDSEDDNFNGLIPAETNQMYINKLVSANSAYTLDLIYNGNVFTGKDVYFEFDNSEQASLILMQVFPGEEETYLNNVPLTPLPKEGYSFQGNTTSETGITFTYSGSIVKNRLSLTLADIKLPVNTFSSQGKWYNQSSSLTWEITGSNSLIWSVAANMVDGLLRNLLLSVLNDVTFLPDGNILAGYAPLPEGADIMNDLLLGGKNYNDRPVSDWQTSPVNMATYYVKDNKLYVIPQIDMLTRTLFATRAELGIGDIIDLVLDLIGMTGRWTSQGMEFTITQNANGTIALTLDKSEIEGIFPLLPYIAGLIPADNLPGIGDILESLLTDAALYTSKFEFTLLLSATK